MAADAAAAADDEFRDDVGVSCWHFGGDFVLVVVILYIYLMIVNIRKVSRVFVVLPVDCW